MQVREWDAEMNAALDVAQSSRDPSTQNGAIVITTTSNALVACNEFPTGVLSTDDRWERPLKYKFVEHAERNAVYSAASYGLSLKGATMVAVWAACSDCARAIVQSGIKRLVRYPNDHKAAHWDDDITIGDTILTEGGVEIVESWFENIQVPEIRRNGAPWQPGAAARAA